MSPTISATDARVHFGELMRRAVESGEPIIVEHNGEPRIVVLSVNRYERIMAACTERKGWRELVDEARQRVKDDLGDRKLPAPEDIIREARDARDEQLALR